MSHPVMLYHYRNGEEVPVDSSVIKDVLASYEYTPSGLETPDGGYAEMALEKSGEEGRIANCFFSLSAGGFTPQVAECIFRMAQAADMVIWTEDGTSVILLDPAQAEHLPPDEAGLEQIICRTVDELQEYL